MLNDLLAVQHLVDGGEKRLRRQWLIDIALSALADFGLILCMMDALEQQRLGEDHSRAALGYMACIGLWFFATRRLYDRTGRSLITGTHGLVDRLVGRLARLPTLQFERLGRGSTIRLLTADAMRLATCGPGLVGGPMALFRLLLGALFAIYVVPNLAGVGFGAMILFGLIFAERVQAMRAGFADVAGDEARVYDVLRGHIVGAIPIKLHARRSKALGQAFSAISQQIRGVRTGLFGAFFERQHVATAVLYGVLGVNVFLLPAFLQIESESVRQMNLLLVWAVLSVTGVVSTLPPLILAADALARIRGLEATIDEAQLEPVADIEAEARARFMGFRRLEVEGLTFAYPTSGVVPGFAIGPIDLRFERGEAVFVTGLNGSGKSTFLKVLTGLYRPAKGTIRIDGEAVPLDALADYRVLFGTIFAHHHLFDRAFGVSADREADAAALLDEMQIGHKTRIADGRVSDVDLSAGQKKRLALVLARLQDRPIVVLDEWAADQDPEFRAIFYRDIVPALTEAGKLVIAVTHDDQYFQHADRAVHFAGGRVVDAPPALKGWR